MNYTKHYNVLIEKSNSRVKPEGYTERHHILPLCLGGTNNRQNLTLLTAREHYVAHLLLAKIYGDRLWLASHLMGVRFKRQSSRMYEKAKHILSARMKTEGRLTLEKNLGIFGRTLDQKREDAVKGGRANGYNTFINKTGVHARSKEQMSADGRKGGKLHFENKTAIFASGIQAKGGKKPHWFNPFTKERKRDYECPGEGFIRGRGAMPRKQNVKGKV